ncbi:hypothetical protein EC991_011093 [Linnemannia zychae]|nr:hypothetical protein EC991_011093 [Linnemannia zychae]
MLPKQLNTFSHFALGILLLAAVLLGSTEAHVALAYPVPRGGFGTKQFNGRVHTWVGYEKFKYPCGGFKPGPTTNLKAGQLIPVRFWTGGMDEVDTLPKKKVRKTSRHGGGMCEFSLSNDGGKSFHVIASYSKTCPDVNYEWPVRIPDNIPSCHTAGKCLFAWSWTPATVEQFYHNCADITIDGATNGSLPKQTIQLYNFGKHPKKTFPGDGLKMSSGPLPEEVKVASSRKSL